MPRYLFGPFEFDSATLDLRRDGAPVRLQSQPAQVLKALLEHTDQIVSRDDLRKSIWGDSTFVDFESGLNFCISQLRSALRDDASQPLYIRTVPKKGYQFIAPVRPMDHRPRIDGTVAATPARPGQPAAFRPLRDSSRRRTPDRCRHRALPAPRKARSAPPIVAVARFDNETGNPAFDSFANNLTDDVVEQLTTWAASRDRVIGNAKILFEPRPERDLRTIASTLNASYIVLGQVQFTGGQHPHPRPPHPRLRPNPHLGHPHREPRARRPPIRHQSSRPASPPPSPRASPTTPTKPPHSSRAGH